MIVTIFGELVCVAYTKERNRTFIVGKVMVACALLVRIAFAMVRRRKKFVSLCVMRLYCFTMVVLMGERDRHVFPFHILYLSPLKANCMIWIKCVCMCSGKGIHAWRPKEWTKTRSKCYLSLHRFVLWTWSMDTYTRCVIFVLYDYRH